MLSRYKTYKDTRIFYPLVFLIFIWPYLAPFGWWTDLAQEPGAWRFVVVTPVIAAIAFLFFKRQWTRVLGLSTSIKQFVAVSAAGVLAFIIFNIFIDFLLLDGGYHLVPQPSEAITNFYGKYPLLSRTLWRICQPLNEEIVLRALFLGFFARFFKHRASLAILAALVFSLLHFLLYNFGLLATKLDLSTLFTLFFFALAANSLYLTFNHIGFGLVIHIAWNWWRFSGLVSKDGFILNEPQSFNALEGSVSALIFVTVLSLVCVFALVLHDYKRKRKSILHLDQESHASVL